MSRGLARQGMARQGNAITAVILGSRSDIAKRLRPLMLADGWSLWKWTRGRSLVDAPNWDVLICFIGSLAPIGQWTERGIKRGVTMNLMHPLRLLEKLMPRHAENASACFLAGPNPNTVIVGYTAYATGKLGLLKAIEYIDAESEVKVFSLGPGYVKTKIHEPSIAVGVDLSGRGEGTSAEQIYACLKWCITQPKAVIGGRNVCVSDPWGDQLRARLEQNPDLYKLRRAE